MSKVWSSSFSHVVLSCSNSNVCLPLMSHFIVIQTHHLTIKKQDKYFCATKYIRAYLPHTKVSWSFLMNCYSIDINIFLDYKQINLV
jgi:hypothetical protein